MSAVDDGGLLLVDKPAGITSHDVVSMVRRAARTRRVGHAGTLDPFASGLLVVAIGEVTRLLNYMHGEPKVYDAEIAFGHETDTDDVDGRPGISAPLPSREAVASAIEALTGNIEQVPPAYSAKHVEGTRAYALARQGREVRLEPVSVTVHRWEVLHEDRDSVSVRITCSGGTYIRALARDLGRLSHSAAHCRSLRRVASGALHVENAVPVLALEPGSIADGRVQLYSPLVALGHLERVDIEGDNARAVANGRAIRADASQTTGRCVFVSLERVAGIGELVRQHEVHLWQPRVVMPSLQKCA